MRYSRFLILLGLLLLSGAFVHPVMAQTTFGSITGTVRDPTGANVPNTMIEATHVESNYKYTAQSNEEGNYTLPQLREGKYRLRATATGFQEYVVQDIQLASREERRIDITFQVGGVGEIVEVTGGASVIQTESPQIGDTKDANQLRSLPLNTRGLYNYLALSPGVVMAGNGFAFRRFSGSRRNQSDQSIDGISASTGQDGTQITPLVSNIESFQEVRVDQANNSADIQAIGQVTVVSKGGTNELHGTLFDYYSTPRFRARDPFQAQRPSGIRHNPGVSLGGPILIPKIYNGRDKSFFFFSYETSQGSAILEPLNPTVPLAVWRSGDFSQLVDAQRRPIFIRDPLRTGNCNAADQTACFRDPSRATPSNPLGLNIIPLNRLNPTALAIQNRFWPLPNQVPATATDLSASNYRAQLSRAFDPNTYFTARLDHRFTDKAFAFARWTWNRSYNRSFDANLPTFGQIDRVRNTRAGTLSFTYTISPTLVSESRYGFAFSNDPRHGPLRGLEVVNSLGLQGLIPDLPDFFGVPNINFTGLGVTSIATGTPQSSPGFRNLIQQYQEHLNYYRGRHTFKAGVQLSHYSSADYTQNANLFGNIQFSNRYTNFPYADFLLGIPSTVSRAFPAVAIDRIRWAYDFFITDDFKYSPKLTFNIGIRYEFHPAFGERNGLLSNFDLATGRIVVPDGSLSKVSPLLPTGFVQVVEASQAGYPSKTLIETDRNNFAPRFGFAYRPWGENTVIRGGYGIFYDVVTRAASVGGSPFVINEPSFTNPTTNPVVILPRVFPATGVGGPTTIGLPGAVRKDLRIPYSMQYSLTLEHQRWNTGFRLSYIGTNTRQGDYSYNINSPLPDTRLFAAKPRLFPQYQGISYRTNGAGHQYHSMQIEAERRFAKGFSWQASYTLAKDLGDIEAFGPNGDSPEYAFDRLREKGDTLDIPRHRVTANTVYELPLGKGKRYFSGAGRGLNALVGGWETSLIFSYYSGQFLTPVWQGPDPTGTAPTTSTTTPATVTIRPDILRDPNLPSDQGTTLRWFDTTAFAAPCRLVANSLTQCQAITATQPPLGRFGTSARGVIQGPGNTVFHAGLAKNFFFGERMRLRLEMTGTNIFNHTNYGNPGLNLANAATFGVITSTRSDGDLDQSGARSFRAGIRFEF